MTDAVAVDVRPQPKLEWQALPADYPLPDEPVDNLDQPLLAEALREALELAGRVTPAMLIATNFGVCATIAGKIVVKAPDWLFVPTVLPLLEGTVRRSYTPHLEGDVPALVMEFLSTTEGDEYSVKPRHPYGKWHFYEQLLQVPTYAIFDPALGALEVYGLEAERYKAQLPNGRGHYWIAALGLFLGVWKGTRSNRTGYWLRWWDEAGELLPWGLEKIEQERQRASETIKQERKKVEQAEQTAERLRQRLQALGIDPAED